MPNPTPALDVSALPSAVARPQRNWTFQIIWIIPILAVLVGLNLAYKYIVERGPTITIAFKSGDGLEAGKTVVQYKGVAIGMVKQLTLAKNNDEIIATVQLNKEAADFTNAGTLFWAVRPRITTSGISGLSTLLSGPFIVTELGTAEGKSNHFTALEIPPIMTAGIPGREFTLKAPSLGSTGVGTQLYYRRLTVGEVVAYELDKNGRDISIKVFINAPYDQYVTTNTRFWNASGIDISLSANGLQIQTESLVSVIAGGIAFETPLETNNVLSLPNTDSKLARTQNSIAAPFAPERAPANSVFQLFAARAIAMRQPDAMVERYVIDFKQSVKGLAVGAPVEFRGVDVGEVVNIGLAFDPKTFEVVQPVEIYLYPERLQARSMQTGELIPLPANRQEELTRIRAFVDKGLRAQLRTASLLTGQQYIGIDFFPNAPKYKLDTTKSPLEMQAVPGVFENVEQSVANLIKNTDKLVKRIDSEVIPELNKTLKHVNTITASDSLLQTDLRNSLREIGKAADSVKTFVDMLDQQPQSLIFGKPSKK